jgi:hypothetical protein
VLINRDNEGFNIKFGVCHYNGNWHRLGYSKTQNGAPIVDEELDWLNEFNYPDEQYTDKQKELFYSAGQAGQASTSQKLGAIKEDPIANELSKLFARTRISSMSQTTQTNMQTQSRTNTGSANAPPSPPTVVAGGAARTPEEVQQHL